MAPQAIYIYMAHDIYIYIYICCCVRKWGAFLRFNRSIMLPFMRSIMGCAESGASNPYFYSVWGGSPGPVILAGARNIGRDLGAPCRKWGCSKHIFALYIWHLLLGSIGCEAGFFLRCAKMPRTAGKMGFLHCRSQICNMKVKIGVSEKKGQNLFLVPHPSSFLCFSVSRLVFAKKKTVFPKSTKFRWNHWKRSAKLARPQNAIFAPKGPK